MRIYAKVKSIGKRKPTLSLQPFDVQQPRSLRQLLTEIVQQNVRTFNEEKPFTTYLLQEQIQDAYEHGKVGFNHTYNDTKQSEEQAITEAILAFEDGIYKVLHNETAVTTLDDALHVQEDDTFTFIKLTMLSGRLW